MEITCDGCGETIELDEPIDSNPRVMREIEGDTAGRVTITYGNTVAHQCADGAFGPP